MIPPARYMRGRQKPNLDHVATLNLAIAQAGGPRAVAERLGISVQAVANWMVCPPTRVLELERLSGVSRYRLRPDVFGKPPKEQT